MTLLALLIAVLVAYGAYSHGVIVVYEGFTIYTVAFLLTLSIATIYAIRSRRAICIIGALLLVINFTAGHLAWKSSDPILYHGILHGLLCLSFAYMATERWQVLIAALFALDLLSAVWAYTFPEARPMVFTGLYYPDQIAWLGHAASVVLGASSGDSGAGIRNWLTGPSWLRHPRYSPASLRPVSVASIQADQTVSELPLVDRFRRSQAD